MNTILNIKTDKALKMQAQELAQEMGIPLTTVINSYLKQFVREQKFTLSIDPPINTKLLAEWQAVSKSIKTDKKEISGSFSTTSDLFKHLGI